MTTVGFGDFYPISLLGRAIVVIACFWGIFLISIMVSALTVAVEFNNQQAASYEAIHQAENEVEYGETATTYLQTILRYNWHVRKTKENPSLSLDKNFRQKKSILFSKLKEIAVSFRTFRRVQQEKIQQRELEKYIQKIDRNITLELERVKLHLNVAYEIRDLLESYNSNQEIIKKHAMELYKETEEISLFKERYLKNLK
jgi:hypothetical protein